MTAVNFIEGVIHAPYFIFIRCSGEYSDEDLVHKLGITGYTRDESSFPQGPHVYVTEDANWMHIADNWGYTLWYMPTIRDAIAEIGKLHDVFTCSVGEMDESHDFVYYRNSRLVRKYVYGYGFYDHSVAEARSVAEDFGTPLPGEVEAMKESGEQRKVLSIASSLGIDLRHDHASIRKYSQSRLPLESPNKVLQQTAHAKHGASSHTVKPNTVR